METLAPVWLCLRLAVLLAGLLIPGAALMRALRLPNSLGVSFAGSAVALYAGALALDALHLRVSLTSLSVVLILVTLAALFVSYRRQSPNEKKDAAEPGLLAPFTRLGALTPFMLLFWAVIGFLLVREPLAGPDTGFRWAFLPEQWLRLGSLDFYPPVSARDFFSYFWAESIPPGVASLHAWAFACGGNFAPTWTIPVTAQQFLALHDLAWRIGAANGGIAAARSVAVLAAACPLLNWSARLGQETGLTAVAALGLAFTLARWRTTARPAWVAAAGLFAALGATTREYGLVFPALAFAALAFGRASRAAWFAIAPAFVLIIAWPLRCALRTGNPFYSLNVAGLFPVNPVFTAWVADNRVIFGGVFADGSLPHALRWFALAATSALIGWLALLVAARKQRHAAFAAAAVAGFLALWLVSVPYTVGGLFYSLRVASPAFALGAVAAGLAFAGARAWLLGAVLLATLPFTLLLPQNPASTPLRDWPAPWRSAPLPSPAGPEQIVPAILAQHAAVILTDSPGFQTLLAPHGVRTIPFWSPQAAWLFDPRTTPADAARRWRESGLRVLVLSKFEPAIAFVNRRARWQAPPFRIHLAAESAGFIVLRIEAPSH